MGSAKNVRQWSARAAEELKYYVYALSDPRIGRIFYIGKGKDNRVFAHADDAEALEVPEGETAVAVSDKIALIREIQAAGLEPGVLILRHGMTSEATAYAVEAALLDFCRVIARSNGDDLTGAGFELTNIAGGWHNERVGAMTPQIVESLYGCEPLDVEEVAVPAIFFKIPKLWTPDLSPEELFEATHGWWHVSVPRASRAQYAFAVSRGVIRAAYVITPDSWRPRREGDRDWTAGEKGRYGFDGAPAGEEVARFVNRNVKHWYRKGDQSQFRYVNC